MDDASEIVTECINGLYGPRFCEHCNKIQPVKTYVLSGSEYQKIEGTKFTTGFTGAYMCAVCYKTIKVSNE